MFRHSSHVKGRGPLGISSVVGTWAVLKGLRREIER